MQNRYLAPGLLAALLIAAPAFAAEQAAPAGQAASDAATDVTSDDTVLASKVKTAVQADKNASSIVVSASQGVVTLSGEAKDKATGDQAARAAMSVPGVKSVNNQMQVK